MGTARSDQMTVVVVRVWFEDRKFRARLIFAPGESLAPESIVVDSLEDMLQAMREAVEIIRPQHD